ncbi:MAG: hypothetical protein RMJ52_15255 [Gemmataceae bacterium]|nr:hypothetical protein [Gemmataceae bacterium]
MSATLNLKLIDEADRYLDADAHLTEFREMGKQLFEVFGADQDRVSTQVRNLQQIAVSARRLSDIEVFVKNQMGKKSGSHAWRRVGDRILEQLAKLRAESNRIAMDEGQRLLLRAYLARGWVKTVVGAYLYAKAQREMNHA